MADTTKLRPRWLGWGILLALVALLSSLAVYVFLDVRRQQLLLAHSQEVIRQLQQEQEKFGRILAEGKTAADQNKKLRDALKGRLEESHGQSLSADDEKLYAQIRELLGQPAGGAPQNEQLRAALKEALAVADLRDARTANAPIEREVEEVRELKFKTPVVYHSMKVADFVPFMRQEMRSQYKEEEFRNYGRALACLGLIPEGMDLEKTIISLLGEQVGAFYDDKKKHLVTFSDKPSSSGLDHIIMAHELTHALDDQHFSLRKLGFDDKDNDDRSIAARALVEGNATMVMGQAYVLHAAENGIGSALKDLGAMFRQNTEQLNKAPAYLRETLTFPYLQGQQFVMALLAHGGMNAVNNAFSHPPISTTQVLHPEKYFAHQEPKEIKLPDFSGHQEWKLLSNNVVGELGIRILLDEKAAGGWNGDRYAVYEVAPNQLLLLWQTAWDTEKDAEEFETSVISWGTKGARPISIIRNSALKTVNILVAPNQELLSQIKKSLP